jgi:hypothetical protein
MAFQRRLNRITSVAGEVAQKTLLDLCDGSPISEEILSLRVHVWRVVRWHGVLPESAARFYLRPVVSVGLIDRPSTDVPNRKCMICIGSRIVSNNRPDHLFILNISDQRFKRALDSPSEREWVNYGLRVTCGLSLAEARRLSVIFGQVVGRIVKNPWTGKPVGFVAISATHGASQALDITTDKLAVESVMILSSLMAHMLT